MATKEGKYSVEDVASMPNAEARMCKVGLIIANELHDLNLTMKELKKKK